MNNEELEKELRHDFKEWFLDNCVEGNIEGGMGYIDIHREEIEELIEFITDDFLINKFSLQRQRLREKLEELREFQPSGSGDCQACGLYMGSGEHYCKEMMKNEVIDEIVDLLEE